MNALSKIKLSVLAPALNNVESEAAVQQYIAQHQQRHQKNIVATVLGSRENDKMMKPSPDRVLQVCKLIDPSTAGQLRHLAQQ